MGTTKYTNLMNVVPMKIHSEPWMLQAKERKPQAEKDTQKGKMKF